MAFYKRFRRIRGERHSALDPFKRFLRFVVIAGISITGMLVVAFLFRVPLRDDIVKKALALANEQGFQVEYQSVWGDLFGGINFKELKVIQDEEHWLLADQVNISYRLLPLLFAQKFEIRSVRIVKPFARWQLPEEKPESTEVFDPLINLNLSSLVIRSGSVELSDTMLLENIQMNAKIEIKPHSVSGRLRNLSFQTLLNDTLRFDLRQARTNFAYTVPGGINISNLNLKTGRSILKGDFYIGDSVWDITLREAKIALDEIAPAYLSGTVVAEGKVAEKPLGYSGDFRLNLYEAELGGVRIADATLILKGEGGIFDLSVIGSNPELGKVEMSGKAGITKEIIDCDLAIKDIELYESTGFPLKFKGALIASYALLDNRIKGKVVIDEANIYPIPEMDIDINGSLDAAFDFSNETGNVSGSLNDIHFQGMPWGNSTLDISFNGDSIYLREFSLNRDLSRISVSGFVKKDSVEADFNIHSFQLGSLEKFNPLGAPAEIDAKITIGGTLKTPHFSGVLLARSNEAPFKHLEASLESFNPIDLSGNLDLIINDLDGPGGKPFYLDGSVKNGRVSLYMDDRSVTTLNTSGILNVNWEKPAAVYECEDILFLARGDTISNRFPFVLGVEKDSLYIGPTFLFVGAGEVAATGSWQFNKMPHLELSFYDVTLETFGGIIGLPEGSRGKLRGQIASRDEGSDRNIIVDLGASDLHINGLDADGISFSGTLDTLRLDFTASFEKDGSITNAEGYAEYDLKDTNIVTYLDIHATIDDIGVWPFGFMKDILEVRSGLVKGELNVKGRLEDPDITGWLNVRGAELYQPVMDLSSESSDADILFKNGKVIIDRLDATIVKEKTKGILSARGDYALFAPGHPFYFGIICQNVPFSPERHIFAISSGNLTIKGTDTTPLRIEGKMEIKRGLITYGLGDEMRFISPYAPAINPNLPPPPPTYLDLSISGEDNIWIANRDMKVEVVPDLYIKLREDPNPQITGTITVKRGEYYYLANRLQFDPSRSKIVFPPTQELNPELDLWTSLRTNVIDSSSGYYQPIVAILHMGGTMYELIPEFFSDPPVWTESEVVSYLNLRIVPGDVTNPDYEAVISQVFTDYLSLGATTLIQKWLPVDIVRIENLGDKDANVTFGKYFGDRWFASYTQAISENPDNPFQFKVEYEIDKKQNIVLERDEKGAHILRWQIKFKF
ncbi:hypothetical protein GX441_08795 [bacterium]|nr:hypothetical protein [bacterium]